MNVSADGETSRQEVAGAALGAELPLADLTDGYVRLVARCAAGESLYTNPIWLDRP